MDKVNKQELRRLAADATEGEWKRNKVFGQLSIQDDNYMLGDADAVFIAAANPAAILSLLDELDRAEQVINQECQAAAAYKMQAVQAQNELEQYRKDAESLRGSCKALGEQNKLLTRRVKSLARAVNWLADTGWGVARPKWLTAILAKEGGANG